MRLKDDKDRVFHSDSTPAILQLLQQWGAAHRRHKRIPPMSDLGAQEPRLGATRRRMAREGQGSPAVKEGNCKAASSFRVLRSAGCGAERRTPSWLAL